MVSILPKGACPRERHKMIWRKVEVSPTPSGLFLGQSVGNMGKFGSSLKRRGFEQTSCRKLEVRRYKPSRKEFIREHVNMKTWGTT